MRIQIINYTFNAPAKTITFDDYGTIEQEYIETIVNLTRGKIIYQANTPGLGGYVSSNALHITASTSLMESSDTLQIYYNDPAILPQGGANINDGLGNPINSQFEDGKRSLYITLLDGNGDPISSLGGGGGGTWGTITGDIEDQTDLQQQFEDTRNFAIAMAIAL